MNRPFEFDLGPVDPAFKARLARRMEKDKDILARLAESDRVDGPCQDCGRMYSPWFTDHALWNRVMGGPDATDDPGGMLCMTCFTDRVDDGNVVWYLSRNREKP